MRFKNLTYPSVAAISDNNQNRDLEGELGIARFGF